MKQVEVQYKSSVQINGKCHEDFQEVVEVFAENYDKYSEIGSSLCVVVDGEITVDVWGCLLYTSPSPRDRTRSRMPSSA